MIILLGYEKYKIKIHFYNIKLKNLLKNLIIYFIIKIEK